MLLPSVGYRRSRFDVAGVTRRHGYKRLVRERMARTGATYSTVRAQLHARASTTPASPPLITVPTNNMARAVSFYTAVLGAELVGHASESWTELDLAGVRLALTHQSGGAVRTGLGLVVADFASTLDAASSHGGAAAVENGAATVFDPDGNTLRVMGANPELT